MPIILPQEGESVLVVLNMSPQAKTVAFDLKGQGIMGEMLRPLLSTPLSGYAAVPLHAVPLLPFATLVGAVH